MEKLYRVVITEIDPETKAEKEVHVDELYKNVTMIADCADREAMAEEEALKIMKSEAMVKWDPDVVSALFEIIQK